MALKISLQSADHTKKDHVTEVWKEQPMVLVSYKLSYGTRWLDGSSRGVDAS
jgi:hypothetical protein